MPRSHRHLRLSYQVAFLAPLLLGPVAHGQDQAADQSSQDAETASPVSLSIGVDYTNSYFFRGLVQDADAFILQPYGGVAYDAWSSGEASLSLSASTWNSFHDSPTGPDPDGFESHWYEADFAVGITAGLGRFSLCTQYVWFTSPSDAFDTIEELCFCFCVDDSDWLGDWAMSPTATLAFETGRNATESADSDLGTYLELGVKPGFEHMLEHDTPLSITFPVSAGFSLANYYEDGTGNDDAFGFVSVGVVASVPLSLFDALNDWTLSGGVRSLFLGDFTSDYNGGDDDEFIITVGLSTSF